MAEFVFEKARADQVSDIFQLFVHRVAWMDENGVSQWNDNGYLEAYPESYYAMRQAEGTLYAVTDKDTGTVVGAIALLSEDDRWTDRWTDRAQDKALYVHHLVTDQSAHGAGAFALQEAEALAKAQGFTYMRLDCDVRSAFLNSYYGRLGYAEVGRCSEGEYEGIRREKRL